MSAFETHPTNDALDEFDERVPVDERRDFVASRPHDDAVFDWAWVSRHGGRLSDGWRFVYACEAYGEACSDSIGSMPATRDPDSHPTECPDCGRAVYRLSRAWEVRRIGASA